MPLSLVSVEGYYFGPGIGLVKEYLKGTIIWYPDTQNIYETEIGSGTTIGSHCVIGKCKIGEDCKIQSQVFLAPGTIVGDRVFIGPGAKTANDRKPLALRDWELRPVIIENDVSIGMGALILAGVRLGEGCNIGMGAVVIRDVEPGDTVVGNPARSIKKELCSECQTPIVKGGLEYCPRCTADLWKPIDD